MYIRLKKKPSIFINIDRFEFLEQIKMMFLQFSEQREQRKLAFYAESRERMWKYLKNISTMKSLILAQDER